jgi:hypothetical protein
MIKKDTSMKLLGVIAVITTGLFIIGTRDNKDAKKLEGLDINIDPEKIVDNITPFITSDERVKNILGNFAKVSISKILG